MSKHLNAIERELVGSSIRATGEAMGMAVAITDQELVVGKAKLFGAKIQRFPLQQLGKISTIPNPSANVLQVDFTTQPPSGVMVMYSQEAQAAFRTITSMLEAHLPTMRP